MNIEPNSTAVRVALWRALHVQIDAPPHIFEDEIGLQLAAPPDGWQQRPDMHPMGTKDFRAGIVGRARFIEDLVEEQLEHGITQYVILGSGLDTFAQRKPELASRLTIFEIDQPAASRWKQKRLIELGYGIPPWLKFVPVDFESNEPWWNTFIAAGFDCSRPSFFASTGVSMYLTKDAIAATLNQIAQLPSQTTLALTFILPLELLEPERRSLLQAMYDRTREAGTPFISFFTPSEIQTLAKKSGFHQTQYVSNEDLIERYFQNRTDDFKPSRGEAFLVAMTRS
ncbi:MAG TPA: class I SAM-dependent methyltransferase [Bacteroidota bacterium]|nr:class I SAM-dependent methyltransferase [Bacteroidota bacterium]